MIRVLGIDTSNYTTSIAVVSQSGIEVDSRKILNVKMGERGLRQSEALFQHVMNLPILFEELNVKNLDAVCVSIAPRPVEGSYMPVFKAGESFAKVISITNSIPLFLTTHQEGHIEAAIRTANLKLKRFIALHLSGGTSEVLLVDRCSDYEIKKIGGTKDISVGQFLDRIGVALGFDFPAGKYLDQLVLNTKNSTLRIPSKVDGFEFNFSGQETLALKYLAEGNTKEDIAYAAMVCVAKTLEKLINNLIDEYKLPILLLGGVASSEFLKSRLDKSYEGFLYFSNKEYASDNAVGVAYIGLNKMLKGE
ncbi:MAG: hypothetical protein N2486_05575 [Caloramator sp.]|nr:hypothetical protein [Caloramator sp.]